MRETLLKIAALFSYCGGPLFIADLLKPRIGPGPAFLITFLPFGLMLVGALCLDSDLHSRGSFTAVRAGRLGLYIVLAMHAHAVWCFVEGFRVADQALHYLGIAVGVAWSIAYLWVARRWASFADHPARAGDPASNQPIEPS